MASGTIKGKFTATAASNVYPEIRWRSTKNDANNNSSVTAELWFVKVSSYWYPYNNSGYTSNININGSNASALRTFDLQSRNSQMIWSRTVTVAHNADGNKSITISSSGSVGLSNMGSVSVSGTAKLDTIPRASSIESISGNQIGGNITVNIKRASSGFTHRVGYYDTDGQRRNEIQDATTSTTFAIPLDRCNLLPNTTSGVAKIVVDTYSGSTKIGTVSKSHTVYVPSSVIPTVNSFDIREGITKVANVKLSANNFVQNMSRLDMTAGASGKYNSTIKDYTFSFNGQSQGGTVGRQFNVGSAVGAFTAKVEVTDSRGRKASKSTTITIHAYNNPRINNFKIYRVDQTTQVKADINFTVSNINSKGGSWSIQKLVGTTWTNTNTGTLTTTHSATGLVVVGTYDVTKSQNFRVVLSDAFGTGATANGSISTAKTLMDFNKDIGIGIGKMHERGTLDVGGDTYLNGGVVATGNFSSKGYTTLTAGSTNSGGNDVMLHLNRTNATPAAVFASNGTAGDFAMNLYNQSGAWTRAHLFKHNGNVELSGDLKVQYWAYAKQFVQDGQHVFAHYTPPELWSGAAYMTGTQTITPSKSLANCRNGWMLAWSDYTNGVANNYDWVFTPIPKSAISAGVNGMHAMVANSNAANAPMLSKYIYVGTGTSIVGQNNNNGAGLDNIVLRKVYEW